jgi:hypothetical protein
MRNILDIIAEKTKIHIMCCCHHHHHQQQQQHHPTTNTNTTTTTTTSLPTLSWGTLLSHSGQTTGSLFKGLHWFLLPVGL